MLTSTTWSWKICYGKKNWALNLELILASTPDKTNYKLLHLECLFLWPDSEKHPSINNSILHSQVSKYTFYNIISFKQNSNVNLYFVPATSFFLLNRKPYGITFWYGSSRHIFRFFLLPAKKWQAQAFCHYFLAGGAMPRAIANGLHYLNWNHNVDVFAHAVVVVVRVSTLKQDV